MNQKSLTYLSSKCVLQYLDADLRFQLSKRAPPIQKTEKSIPLKINRLVFKSMEMTVNNTNYKFGLYTENGVEAKNNENYDLTPGDLKICKPDYLDDYKEEEWNQATTETPSFSQQTTTTLFGTSVEKVFCKKSLFEAFKELTTEFFANRKDTIKVKQLEVMSYSMIIPLPFGLKFKIEKLKTNGYFPMVYVGLRPIIDKSSFPLKCLELEKLNLKIRNAGDNVIKSARNLIIHGAYYHLEVIDLKYPKVHVIQSKSKVPRNYFIAMIRLWLARGKIIGTCHTFEFDKKEDILDVFKLISDRMHVEIIDNRKIIISMNRESSIQVYYRSTYISSWILKVKVVQN